VTEPTWREIRELTRLRRRQAATVRHSITHYARERIATYDQISTYKIQTPGLVSTNLINVLWNFQCGRCYMCDRKFSAQLLATKEHVRPKAKGGVNAGNILLACVPCNNVKGDRDPTKRELHLLALYNTEARFEFHVLLMTNTPTPMQIVRVSKRKRARDGAKKIYADLTPKNLPPPLYGNTQRKRARRAIDRAKGDG